MRKPENYKEESILSKEERRNRFLIMCAIATIFLVVTSYFAFRYLINKSFVDKYRDGKYENLDEDSLFALNCNDPYLPYYNRGNVYYQNGDYEDAELSYIDALSKNPEHDGEDSAECNIRVNLALSMLQQIDFDNIDSDKDIERAIDQLLACRDVLVEEGCADEEGTDGHDPEAEQLKEEIDDLIEQLQQQCSGSSSDDNSQDQSDGSGDEESDEDEDNGDGGMSEEREEEIEDELEDERSQSFDVERSESGSSYDTSPGEYNGFGNGDPEW